MADESITEKKSSEKLDELVRAVTEEVDNMTKEEHIAQFKSIGFLTEDGKVAPEFEGVGELIRASAG